MKKDLRYSWLQMAYVTEQQERFDEERFEMFLIANGQ
jgi:hypothetical protein